MASDRNSRQSSPGRWHAVFAIVALAGVLGVTGCSSVPDALNPVEWYKSTVSLFSDDDEAELTTATTGPAAQRNAPPPGADGSFPNLASVPERPAATARAERSRIVEGLVADQSRARYSSEVIQRQGESAPPPPPPLSAPVRTARAAIPPAPKPRQGAPSATAAPSAPPPARSPVPAARTPAPMTMAAPAAAPTAAQRSSPVSVAETYRTRLREQGMLPSELKVAQNTSPSPANEVTPMSYDGGQTVVISSKGVEFVGAQASFAPRQITPAADRSSRPVPLSSLPAGGRIRVATIIFSHGSTHLSDRDRQILREVRAVQQSRGGRLVVVGHASSRTRSMDTVRHKMVNYRVSAARADAVAAALTSLGIPRDSIQVDARSDSEPVFYEVMPTGEAGNRRAEVYLES